jgi:hypothetical protein
MLRGFLNQRGYFLRVRDVDRVAGSCDLNFVTYLVAVARAMKFLLPRLNSRHPFSFGEFALVRVKGQKAGSSQVASGGDVQNIDTTVSISPSVRVRDFACAIDYSVVIAKHPFQGAFIEVRI